MDADPRLLIHGLDTAQAAYYLRPHFQAAFRFEPLMVAKERLRADKNRNGSLLRIGAESFLLQAYGSKSGYPLVLDHSDYTIECGEFNNPSFFVTYRSKALWQKGAKVLHAGFLQWADSVGLIVIRPETLSRCDFAFDYYLPSTDFDSDSVVSLSRKDAQYRGDRKVQTIQYGKGDVVLRIYNKVVEIEEQSDKVWLFQLWGISQDVWRVEWQVRKDVLRRFSIRTFADLFAGYGDVLRYLASEHDTLRMRSDDNNRSRWPLHPVWIDLIGKRLRDRSSSFGRDYLRAVVDKVVVNGDTATISGSNAKLMRAIAAKKPVAGQVPSFIHDWCARRDSNSRPPGS